MFTDGPKEEDVVKVGSVCVVAELHLEMKKPRITSNLSVCLQWRAC